MKKPADGRLKKSGEQNKNKSRRNAEEYELEHVMGAAPSRSQVDAETQKYFSEVKGLLETLTDETERATLCSSALAEARGKELKLACHPSCGRTLEKLFEACEAVHRVSFLEQCTSSLEAIALDPFGSHVVETLFKSIAEALQQGLESELVASIHNALKKSSEVFQKNALDIMTSPYGSHALRRFIFLLAGLSFDSEKDARTKKLGRANAYATDAKTVKSIHMDFPEILKLFLDYLLTQCKESMRELRVETYGSPVFQTVLKALSFTGHDTTDSVAKILGVEAGREWKPAEVEQIVEMMENQNASHLMEVIVETAQEDIYVLLFDRVFLPNLKRLATHHFSNFVVQTLVTCAHTEKQVESVLNELGKSFGELIKNKKAGVIMSILGACSRFSSLQKEAVRSVLSAFCPQSVSRDSLVPRMLYLENGIELRGNKRMSTLGCAMLQTILTFSQDYIQQFNKSFSVMEAGELLKAGKDQAGCHTVEAFLKSGASIKQKSSVISRFKGHFAELAADTRSHYLVIKCYDAADMKLREMIVSELVPVHQELLKANHGLFIIKKLNVSTYERAPDRWRANEKSKQAVKAGFAEMFDSGKGSDSVAIDQSSKKKRKADCVGGVKSIWKRVEAEEDEFKRRKKDAV